MKITKAARGAKALRINDHEQEGLAGRKIGDKSKRSVDKRPSKRVKKGINEEGEPVSVEDRSGSSSSDYRAETDKDESTADEESYDDEFGTKDVSGSGKGKGEGNGKGKGKRGKTKNRGGKDGKERRTSATVDNQGSVGDRVISSRSVVSTRLSLVPKRTLHVNCRVHILGRILSKVTGRRREIVKDMGFMDLVHLDGCELERKVCYWLMTRVDVDTRTLTAGDGREFVLDPVQVRCILGIPMGAKPVPDDVPVHLETFGTKVDRWFLRKENGKAGMKKDCKQGYCIQTAQEYVERVTEHFNEQKFRAAMMIVLVGQFLCSSSNYTFVPRSYKALLCVAESASEYDWCSRVLDCLMDRIASFLTTFKQSGWVSGYGGCVHFLMVFYLDRLNRPPVRWREYPRVKVWKKDLMLKVAALDQLEGGDFGKLESVDAAYGEAHPRGPRDVYEPEQLSVVEAVNEVGRRLSSDIRRLNRDVKVLCSARFGPTNRGYGYGFRPRGVRRRGGKQRTEERSNNEDRTNSDKQMHDDGGDGFSYHDVNDGGDDFSYHEVNADGGGGEEDPEKTDTDGGRRGEEDRRKTGTDGGVCGGSDEEHIQNTHNKDQNNYLTDGVGRGEDDPKKTGMDDGGSGGEEDPKKIEAAVVGRGEEDPNKTGTDDGGGGGGGGGDEEHIQNTYNEDQNKIETNGVGRGEEGPEKTGTGDGGSDGEEGPNRIEADGVGGAEDDPKKTRTDDGGGGGEEDPQKIQADVVGRGEEDPKKTGTDDGGGGGSAEEHTQSTHNDDKGTEKVNTAEDMDVYGDENDSIIPEPLAMPFPTAVPLLTFGVGHGEEDPKKTGTDDGGGGGSDEEHTQSTHNDDQGTEKVNTADDMVVSGDENDPIIAEPLAVLFPTTVPTTVPLLNFDLGKSDHGKHIIIYDQGVTGTTVVPELHIGEKASRADKKESKSVSKAKSKKRPKRTDFTLKLLEFVRKWGLNKRKSHNRTDTVLIRFAGELALHSSCYGVLSCTGMVDNLFVNVFCGMYTVKWRIDFPPPLHRIFLPPTLEAAKSVLQRILTDQVMEQDLRIFIPMCVDCHWICFCFDFTESVVWMIDSMFKDPFSHHQQSVNTVVAGMEEVLSNTEKWVTGGLSSWDRRVVPIVTQTDIKSCGVIMLLCVLECAHAIPIEPFSVKKIAAAREDLLLSLLLSEMNEIQQLQLQTIMFSR